MMGPSPWHLELNEEDGKLYIFKNGSRMKAEGNYKDGDRPFISNVLNARRHLSDDGKLYIVFQVPRGSPQPKALRTDAFRWDANDITRLLHKGDFCDQWNQRIATNMSRDGKLDVDAVLKKSGNKDKDAQPEGSTSRKRPTASAQAGDESSKRQKTATVSGNDDLDMDKIIKDHYLGQFTVPVTCLVEPHHSRLIRQPYEPHIKGLKEEMRLNPTCDVAPIVAQVLLREGQKFDEAHPEAFKYETLGGNHTRIALTQLLEEDKELASLPYYRARLVSVYAWLSTEQAQHLALRHNRATEYTNKLTTQDQVQICRLRLYSLAKRDLSEEPPEKTTKWRQSCMETLMMTKKQLDERMIYFLAGLPNTEYKLLQQVFALYEDGKLVKVPKAKLGMIDTKLDCRGSNFKGLRNLDMPTINDVLNKIINKEIEFASLGSICKEIKKIRSLKDEFVRLVGASSWEAAQDSYPGYANEGIFKRKFEGIPFAKDMPAMVSFCQKAMRTTSVVPRDAETLTNVAAFQNDCNDDPFFAVFLPLPATSLTYCDVEKLIPNFSGFSLAMFHLSPSADIAEVEDVSRMCKAVNTAAHRSGFTLLITMSEKHLGKCMEMLEEENYTVLIGYINTEEAKGKHAMLLKPVIKPFILAFNNLETIKPLLNFSADRGNLFTCPTLANFTVEMVTMVATKGDHVLLINCCTDEVVSALRMERNAYVVGKDVQRMQSKVMKEMSKDEDENQEESNDISEKDDC